MDPHASNLGNASSPSTLFDAVIRIGLVAVLVYACGRIVLPFAGILAWSAILAVMVYPLHLRLASRLGDRWSALLIGLLGVAVALGPMVVVVTSLTRQSILCLKSAEPRTQVTPATALARRHPIGWQEIDRGLDVSRY
jgi:predicted PurR-regulated permease PerM